MDEPDPCQHEQIRMALWRSFGCRIAGIDEWSGRNLSWAAENSRARPSTFSPHTLSTSLLKNERGFKSRRGAGGRVSSLHQNPYFSCAATPGSDSSEPPAIRRLPVIVHSEGFPMNREANAEMAILLHDKKLTSTPNGSERSWHSRLFLLKVQHRLFLRKTH